MGTISETAKYRLQLETDLMHAESAFFSSKPVDLGYTDAKMLDSLIADSEK